MRYPQAYLFVNRDPNTFDPAAIEAWANGSPIYIQGHSKRSRTLEKRINLMSEVAGSIGDSVLSKSCVVVHGNRINEMLILGLESTLSHLYWLDESDHAKTITHLIHAQRHCWHLQELADDVLAMHYAVLMHFGSLLDSYVGGDEAALTELIPFAEGTSALQTMVRSKLKAIVRRGIVNRIDLQ